MILEFSKESFYNFGKQNGEQSSLIGKQGGSFCQTKNFPETFGFADPQFELFETLYPALTNVERLVISYTLV